MPLLNSNTLHEKLLRALTALNGYDPQALAQYEPGWEYGNVLPMRAKGKQLEWALPGILKEAVRAFTAPKRAAMGEMSSDPRAQVAEALNLATTATLGGIPGGAKGPGSLGVVRKPGERIDPEDIQRALGELKRSEIFDVAPGTLTAEEINTLSKHNKAINAFTNTKLRKYLEKDFATENDPIRLLAETQDIHMVPEGIPNIISLQGKRLAGGFPPEGIARSPLAQKWEDRADSRFRFPTTEDAFTGLTNPYETSEVLGFEHMIDILSEEMGAGRLRPETLQKGQLSLVDAVRKVAGVNRQMAENARKADLASLAALRNAPAVKAYPSGHKWIEMPDASSSKAAMEFVNTCGKAGELCTQYPDNAKFYTQKGKKTYTLIDPEGFPAMQTTVEEPFSAGAEAVTLHPSITQFKPVGNSWSSETAQRRLAANPKWKEEVLPYAQDFVKSHGPWTDVADLDMLEMYQLNKGNFTLNELKKVAQQQGLDVELLEKSLKDPYSNPGIWSKPGFETIWENYTGD